jgi:hypothetical protein
MAESVFKKNGSAAGAMGSAMAFGLVHISPINENQFWMSAPGEESGFTQSVSPSEGLTSFGTTPGASLQYKTSYQKDRSTCWLGFKCP